MGGVGGGKTCPGKWGGGKKLAMPHISSTKKKKKEEREDVLQNRGEGTNKKGTTRPKGVARIKRGKKRKALSHGIKINCAAKKRLRNLGKKKTRRSEKGLDPKTKREWREKKTTRGEMISDLSEMVEGPKNMLSKRRGGPQIVWKKKRWKKLQRCVKRSRVGGSEPKRKNTGIRQNERHHHELCRQAENRLRRKEEKDPTSASM